jgi:glucose/arabinose dehydrogenase
MRHPAAWTALALLGLTSGASAQLQSSEAMQSLELSTFVSDVGEVTDLTFLTDGRAVIVRKSGEIAVAMPDGSIANREAGRIDVDTGSEKGLLGVVRDEDDTLYFYASTGEDAADKHKVYRGAVEPDGAVSVDLSRSIVGSGLRGPANHDGGGLVIHRGQLYVSVGDTGHNASPPQNRLGSCLNSPNAKILRVGLDGSIPDDNPLVGMAAVTGCASHDADYAMLAPDPRIYTWGLRNPWRFWIDPETDLLWIGDVGEITQEEITVGGKGAHHGWPFFEGAVSHGALGGVDGCAQVAPSTPCTPPQHAYGRSDGSSVTGGLIPPKGCGWGAYEERYFFGDYGNGQVWTMEALPDRSGLLPDTRSELATVPGNVSFRMGPDGAMYIASYTTGVVQRLAPKSVPAACRGADLTPEDAPRPPPVAPAPSDGGVIASGGDGGCGCRLAERGRASAFWLGALVIALRLHARRQRGAP